MKYRIGLIFLLTGVFNCFAKAYPADLSAYVTNQTGEYTIYEDRRDGNYRYIGYLNLDPVQNKTLIYILDHKRTNALRIICTYDPDKSEITNIQLRTNNTDPAIVSGILTDFANNLKDAKTIDLRLFPAGISITNAAGSICYYEFWIPMTHLYGFNLGSENSFRLVNFGRIVKSADADNFFKFYKVPPMIIDEGLKEELKSDKKYKAKLEQGSITLDSNWNSIQGENTTYVLTNKSPKDASIFAETLNLDEVNLPDITTYIRIALNLRSAYISPETIDIKYSKDTVTLNYNVYDPKTALYTKSIKIFRSDPANPRIYKVLNFDSFLQIYNQNVKYFDEIIQSAEFH